jgi:hypothetical protein
LKGRAIYCPNSALYAADRLQDFDSRTMTRFNAHLGKTTDMLSAFFLLLVVMLAGGYGPSTASAHAQTSQSSPTDLGAGGHRSVPFVSKQQMLAGEARDLKAAPLDDGKPKAFLAAKGLELEAVSAGAVQAQQAPAFNASVTASPYEARAPPAQS